MIKLENIIFQSVPKMAEEKRILKVCKSNLSSNHGIAFHVLC